MSYFYGIYRRNDTTETLPSSGTGGLTEDGWRQKVEEVVLLVTNSDLRGALRTALTPYRLLRLALAHDGKQCLQEDVQQGLHHHLHLLLHRRVLETDGF